MAFAFIPLNRFRANRAQKALKILCGSDFCTLVKCGKKKKTPISRPLLKMSITVFNALQTYFTSTSKINFQKEFCTHRNQFSQCNKPAYS